MNENLDIYFKPIVLVTGFGPFIKHPVNASWEAVKLLNKDEIEKKHNVELVQIELPVIYENVDEFVPALWETHEPILMLHVGVSSIAQHLTLEKQAHKKGYQRMDYFDQCPANHTCPADGAVRLHTKLDVDQICDDFNNSDLPEGVKAIASLDAGRYVCEYTYYRSLSVAAGRTLFVHVPAGHVAGYGADNTARCLERVLELALRQAQTRQ
ncbi:unnamed protein product [Leptidea sinapis]|uniref:Pyroglutamyl-peptidase I n=1 Tax=Leptidea sinapis TaxID=189913 RepID=A0A5E4QIE7_9NEOP|nr:unnamed protein product [Leptidea sinapis]